ncbi:hypothetical protein QBC42DRAFT_295082 [Cladorrhinum samala]|uniref:Uncharacterized protein n=1 Tax=Cladorrhinum samala TaxID=585594 RepID=A0AAV9HU52_9PEZI|nr:hypothetical protein QBC42DRAFT_295082 [Cladorrhinum samala]
MEKVDSKPLEPAPQAPDSPITNAPNIFRTETSLTDATLVDRHASPVSEDMPTGLAGNPPRKKSYSEQPACYSTSPVASKLFSAATHKESPTTGLRSKLFQTLHDQSNALLQPTNLAVESNIDVLRITCEEGIYLPGQNTKQVEAVLGELEEYGASSSLLPSSPPEQPRLLAFFIKLEKSPSAAFGHRASISQKLVEELFAKFDVHQSFLGDLVGRPDYWSASGRVKNAAAGGYEFFCQHPRWAQASRYETGKGAAAAMQGHRAPCSVYMHHSRAQNLTLYLIAASASEDWIPSVLDRVGVLGGGEEASGLNTGAGAGSRSVPSSETRQALASSPFMLHAILSTVAFEQSIGYVAAVRDRLMTQIKQVNDYSDSDSHRSGGGGGGGKNRAGAAGKSTSSDRAMLENITRELHSVSQTADTGIANAHMSIKIAERMLEAHSAFMMMTTGGADLDDGSQKEGPAQIFIRDTHNALEYVRNSFYCQKDWLSSYKARKDTAMNFVFNVVTQHDSATNVEISYRMAQDSSSMNAVTILTLIFLPGTFLSTVFSSVAFSSSETGAAETTDWFVPFIIAACLLTVGSWSVWYFRSVMARWRLSAFLRAKKALSRRRKVDGGGDIV